ncbi:hypothetical protein EGW08_020453 [Elysia chlorotica]|uniref:Uncharacterized protein n=1 Tax=Elysia chlorotica TaxID=188477 RepID=A0A3S1H415_ELYCH|nr:hypothetical protein EGW08_020453 [Elysia chlorotica]
MRRRREQWEIKLEDVGAESFYEGKPYYTMDLMDADIYLRPRYLQIQLRDTKKKYTIGNSEDTGRPSNQRQSPASLSRPTQLDFPEKLAPGTLVRVRLEEPGCPPATVAGCALVSQSRRSVHETGRGPARFAELELIRRVTRQGSRVLLGEEDISECRKGQLGFAAKGALITLEKQTAGRRNRNTVITATEHIFTGVCNIP